MRPDLGDPVQAGMTRLGRIIELNRNPVTNQRIQRPMSMNDLHRTITLDQQDNNLGTRQLII